MLNITIFLLVRVRFLDNAVKLNTSILIPTTAHRKNRSVRYFIGVTTQDEAMVKKIFYPGNREKVKMMASQMPLDYLRRVVSK